MKTDTKKQLVNIIRKNGPLSPAELVQKLSFSPQIIHRHLRALLDEGQIEKLGTAPRVKYIAVNTVDQVPTPLDPDTINFMDDHFAFLANSGELMLGAQAFSAWCQKTSQEKNIVPLSKAYRTTRTRLLPVDGLVDATQKFQATFKELLLDVVYYGDFWALPQFGRTKLGLELTLGKSGQSLEHIKKIAQQSKKAIARIIKSHRIEALAFAPHSIPRRVQFLKHFATTLNAGKPEIALEKIFAHGIPIAQKSLPKLEDRIENARSTIFPKSPAKLAYKRILIIDDAVGSGATLNEIAGKLRARGAKYIVGFAVVGSLKGFEVLSEV